VVSRTTAFAYRGKAEDVKAIGKELGVGYVLEGSAHKSGARVRVNAQLIDAETGAHLWTDQFDADQGEMLEMQDEIITRLARALQIQLTTVRTRSIMRRARMTTSSMRRRARWFSRMAWARPALTLLCT